MLGQLALETDAHVFSLVTLKRGITLKDEGSCFLLCPYLQAMTLHMVPAPLIDSLTQEKPRLPSVVTTLVLNTVISVMKSSPEIPAPTDGK